MDLIVVGTREALTMVEAGADQVPRTSSWRRSSSRTPRSAGSATRWRTCASRSKPKWVDTDLTAELEAEHGEAVHAAIAGHGLREASAVVDQLVATASPEISMASTEDDMVRRATQVRASFAAILEKARLAAVEGPMRSSSSPSYASSPTRSRTRRSCALAKRDLLFDRILEDLELPFPVGQPSPRASRRSRTRSPSSS